MNAVFICGILEKIGAVEGDFGKVFVGEFGVVDCYGGVTAVDYEGLDND